MVLTAATTTVPISRVRRNFLRHVRRTKSCWLWIGAKNAFGYGIFSVTVGKLRRKSGAHRWSYVLFVGSIPDGLEVDHLCKRRVCVRPSHLEVITRIENMRRSDAPGMEQHRTGLCKRGHSLSDAFRKRNGHVSYCRTCRRARYRERYRTDASFRERTLARTGARIQRIKRDPVALDGLRSWRRSYEKSKYHSDPEWRRRKLERHYEWRRRKAV